METAGARPRFALIDRAGASLLRFVADAMIRLLLALVLTLAAVAPIGAAASPPARCEQLKLTAAGKAAAGVLRCYAKGVSTGVPTSSECLERVSDRTSTAFARA